MLIAKGYNEEEHYSLIKEWATAVDQTPPPKDILPRGVIVYDKDIPVCSGFCYISEITPLAVFSWIFFNSHIQSRTKVKALRECLETLELIALDNDKKFIMADTFAHGIYKAMEKDDYILANYGAYHCIKILKEEV